MDHDSRWLGAGRAGCQALRLLLTPTRVARLSVKHLQHPTTSISARTTWNDFDKYTTTARILYKFNMATLMLTPSRFSSSLSGSQAPYRSHDAPSIADTLPSIDFNFNDLRERMSQFTARFDEFIERGRKRVLEERNAFRMSVAELEGTSAPRFLEPQVENCAC